MSAETEETLAEPVSVERVAPAPLYPLIALMVVFWSVNFIIAKIVLREMPPFLLGPIRIALAGLAILPVYCWRNRTGPWLPSGWPMLVFLALLGVALNQLSFMAGLARTSAAHAAIIIGVTPILVLLIAAFLGQEELAAAKFTGMGIALAGVALLQFAPSKMTGTSALGDVLILFAAISFALFTVLGKRSNSRYDSLTMITFLYLSGGLLLAPVALIEGAHFDLTRVSARVWLSLFFMAVFPSLISYLIYYYALGFISAARLSTFTYLQPLLVTALAAWFLNEPLTGWLLAGGAMVLVGVYVTERS